MRSNIVRVVTGAALVALLGGGCGSSSTSTGSASKSPHSAAAAAAVTTTTPGRVGEINPAGDIPDNQAYVRYAHHGVSVKVPEGWSRVTSPSYVLFTDKLNSIRIEMGKPTSAAAEVTRLSKTVPGFVRESIATVPRPAGQATKITYLAKAPANPVTGKRVTDAVERYSFRHKGREVVLTLSGPKGADNVDPWRIVTTSVRFVR